MKKLLLLIPLLFINCKRYHEVSEQMDLRQLNYNQSVKNQTNASFFMFIGNYSSTSIESFRIRVFAEEKDMYRFYDLPLDMVSISVNKDSLATPYMKVYYKYEFGQKKPTIQKLLRFNTWDIENINIVVPEKYFPKEYNEIKLK